MTTYERQENGGYLVKRTDGEAAIHEAGHVVMAELLGLPVTSATISSTQFERKMGSREAAAVGLAGKVAMELARIPEPKTSESDQDLVDGWLRAEHPSRAYDWTMLEWRLSREVKAALMGSWPRVQEVARHLEAYGTWTPNSQLSQERNLAGERDLEIELLKRKGIRAMMPVGSYGREVIGELIGGLEARLRGEEPEPSKPRWATVGGKVKIKASKAIK